MNKICRICLEEGVLSPIFTRDFTLSISDMMEYCSNIKISKNDGLPEQLCSNCIYKLGIAYHFKQTCESADDRLRHYLGLQRPFKNVDASVMTDPLPPPVIQTIRKCKCKQAQQKKYSSNYKRKPESEKLRRGPKPKPKQVHACFQCEKEFKCQAQLDMHVRTHTGDKPFTCMYCPRKFTQKHNLTIHLRIHTGEKPFQCEICSKSFSAQGNLQTHLKIHTGQRDHVCALCNKSFITSSELTRHMCKHRGAKDHKCDICGSAFVQSRDLKIHKQKKHQIIPPRKVAVTRIIPEDIMMNKNDEIDIEDISRSTIKDNLQHSMNNIVNVVTNSELPSGIMKNEKNLEEQKKSMFHQYPHERFQQTVTCTLCGEVFNYISLNQHYTIRHKDYHP